MGADDLKRQADDGGSAEQHEVAAHGSGLVEDGVHGGDVADENNPESEADAEGVDGADVYASPARHEPAAGRKKEAAAE